MKGKKGILMCTDASFECKLPIFRVYEKELKKKRIKDANFGSK